MQRLRFRRAVWCYKIEKDSINKFSIKEKIELTRHGHSFEIIPTLINIRLHIMTNLILQSVMDVNKILSKLEIVLLTYFLLVSMPLST